MTSPEIISTTNAALLEVARRYFETVVPHYQEHGNGFMEAYLGRELKKPNTIIYGDPETLTIGTYGDEGAITQVLTIDLPAPGVGLATIIKPGQYNADGEVDVEHGEYMRLVDRLLTEGEGRELVMDFYCIIKHAPDRYRKSSVH